MNSISANSVGQTLRKARETLGASLEDAAKATFIKTVYLQELENDHPEKFISEAQARGFLRLYAKYLSLSYEELVALWDQPAREKSGTAESAAQPDGSKTGSGGLQPGEAASTQAETADASAALDENQAHFSAVEDVQLEDKQAPFAFFSRIGDGLRETIKKIPALEKLSKPRVKRTAPSQQEAEQALAAEEKVSSQELFEEIGAALQQQRQKMQLSLTDIEQFTNIKRMYLNAIEDGRFSDLPSTVQGRGMLNIYAQFLAMDGSAIMNYYGRALQIQREELLAPRRKPAQPAVTVNFNLPASVRRVLNSDLIVGGALIIALFGFIIWGANQMLSVDTQPTVEAPSISDVLQITPTATLAPEISDTAPLDAANGEQGGDALTPAGVEVVPPVPTPIATIDASPLQLYIIAHDRAFLNVVVDGREVFNGRVSPDNVYTYSGQNVITLLTGNGAALEVYFNQEYLGELGRVGEVINLRFTAEGVATPTPQPAVEEEMQS